MSGEKRYTCREFRRALRVPLGTPRWPTCASSRCAKSCPQKSGGSYPAGRALRASCGMILLCDLSRMAAPSTPSPFPPGGAPFRVMPQLLSDFRKLVGSARRREKRGPRRDEVPREDERASGPRLLRQRAIAPQVRRQCFTRRRTEEAIMSDCKSLILLKAVVSSRGPAGGWEGDTQCSPQPPTCVSRFLSSTEAEPSCYSYQLKLWVFMSWRYWSQITRTTRLSKTLNRLKAIDLK